jgi:hypothetical protein
VLLVHFPYSADIFQAETHLTHALRLCHGAGIRNRELILTYLIPCHLLTTHTLPTASLLAPFPNLRRLFGPLSTCIRRGDLSGFDAALAAGQDEFVKRRIYLTLERGRDITLRNLFRKVFIAGDYEDGKDGRVRRTRVPVGEFVAAMRMSVRGSEGGDEEERAAAERRAEEVDREEVECLIANMIYKVSRDKLLTVSRKLMRSQNLMKGYISREHAKVVLSKAGAFPGTGV